MAYQKGALQVVRGLVDLRSESKYPLHESLKIFVQRIGCIGLTPE